MNTIQFRVIRYIVDKEVYYLGTTLRDSLFTIDVLKDLYWMRWNIETFFKTIKYDLSFDDVHSFSAECIKQEIYCHEFIIVLTRILEEGFIRHKNLYEYMKNKKTNFKQNLNAVCDKVIRMILYSPGCENSILGIFVVLFNYAYTVVENRNYPRVRIIPPSKWYGNSVVVIK